MAEKQMIDIDQYVIGSYADVEKILQDVELEIIKLVKKIRVALDAIPGKIQTKLKNTTKDIRKLVDNAFQVDSLEEYQHVAAVCGRLLANSLLQLQGKFTQLQNAILSAAAPIAQVLLPVIHAAVDALTGFANSIGYALRSFLLGGGGGGELRRCHDRRGGGHHRGKEDLGRLRSDQPSGGE